MKILKAVLISLLFIPAAWSAATELKVAVSGFSGIQREALMTLGSDFQAANPNIKINFVLTEDNVFKDRLNDWLSRQGEFDLVIWHAGQRLQDIATLDYVCLLYTFLGFLNYWAFLRSDRKTQ